MWMPSDVMAVINEILMMAEKKGTIAEYKKALKPLINQAALNEQSHIIHMLVASGMSMEEVAKRLNRSKEYIAQICGLNISGGTEYDYSYIEGAKSYAYDENRKSSNVEVVEKGLCEKIYFVNMYSTKSRLSKLIQILLAENDIEKIQKACEDENYREELYKEYNIKELSIEEYEELYKELQEHGIC